MYQTSGNFTHPNRNTELNNSWVCMELWRSSSSNTSLKVDQLEQFVQDKGQSGLEHLQRLGLHNLSGQLVPLFDFCDCKLIGSYFHFLHLIGVSFISICSRCLSFYHLVLLRRVLNHLLYFLPLSIYTHWKYVPRAFSSQGQTVPALSASHHMLDAPSP